MSVSRNQAIAAALLLLVVILFWLDIGKNVPQLDDAYISYRYAANLAAGHGLVFNVGEYVEGYTNLSWTLLVALFMRLGDIGGGAGSGCGPGIGLWLSVVFGTLSLVATYGYTKCLSGGQNPILAVMAPAVLLCSNQFAAWSTGGLETPLYLLLVIGACWAETLERRWLTAWMCVLATATRPEGALLAACLLLPAATATLWRCRRMMPPSRAATAALLAACSPAMAYAACLGGLTLFRLYYYHALLPNTAYAKIGTIPLRFGFIYTATFLTDGPGLVVPLALLGGWQLRRYRAALLFCAATAVYVIAIGGDFFASGRFLLAPFAVLLAGATAAAGHITARHSRRAAILTLAASAFWSLMVIWPSKPVGSAGWQKTIGSHVKFASFSRVALTSKRQQAELHGYGLPEDLFAKAELARFARMTPPARLVATSGIGRIGYFGMNIRILDLLGLVDKHIARSSKKIAGTIELPGHSRTDADYVLSRMPDVIMIPERGTQVFLLMPAVADLWRNPRLDQLYEYDKASSAYVLRSSAAGLK